MLASRKSGSRSLARRVFKLSQRKILGKPTGHFAIIYGLGFLAIREFRFICDVSCLADLILMPRDQHAIFGEHQIRLNKVRALLYRQLIGREGVLGPLSTSAAMGDYNGRLLQLVSAR